MMIVLNLTQIILLVLLAVRQQLTNNVDVYIDVYSGRQFDSARLQLLKKFKGCKTELTILQCSQSIRKEV